MKRQIQLVTLVSTRGDGLEVLGKLGVCRVWMRLCLLLLDKDSCQTEVTRLLQAKPWLNTVLWPSIMPGLMIYGLKQPQIKSAYKEHLPEEVLSKMRKESSKFDDVFK